MVGRWQQNGSPYRRRGRSILIAAFIALCLAVGVTACILSRHAGPRPGIPQAVGTKPTAQRPIVWDVGHAGSYYLFGGKDGSKRIRIKLPKELSTALISRGGKVAAAVCAPLKAVPFVVFYDAEGKQMGRVQLPRKISPYRNDVYAWLGDRGEAVVWIAGATRIMGAGSLWNPASYYVSAAGVAKRLDIDLPRDVIFPESGGFAVLLGKAAMGCQLRKYSAPDKLAWTRKMAHTNSYLRFYPAKPGADISVVDGRTRFWNFSKDGKLLDLKRANAKGQGPASRAATKPATRPATKPARPLAPQGMWAWFLASPEREPLSIVYASAEVTAAKNIVKNWTRPEFIMDGGGHAPGSPGYIRANLEAAYGDMWFPYGGYGYEYCVAVHVTYSGKQFARASKATVYLPAGHAAKGVETIHAGIGPRLLAGDLPSWDGWRGSRFFNLGKRGYLLVEKYTRACLITSPPARYKMKSTVKGIMVPMRLGGNPYMMLRKDPSKEPRILSCCRFRDRIFMASSEGKLAQIKISGKVSWKAELAQPFGRARVFLFGTQRRLVGVVQKGKDAKWTEHSSEDGRKWKVAGALPLSERAIPLYLDDTHLCAIEKREKDSLATVYMKEARKWRAIAQVSVPSREKLLDVAIRPTEAYLLVGTPGKGDTPYGLEIQVRRISLKRSEGEGGAGETAAGDPVVRRFDPGEKFPNWNDRGWANLKKMLAKYPMELKRPEAKTLCIRVVKEPAGLLSSGPWASVEAAPENAVANPFRGARAIRVAVVHKERGYRANIRAWVCPSSFAAMRKAIQASEGFISASRMNTWGGVKPIPVTSASYVANFARGWANEVIWSVGNMAVVLMMSEDTDKSFASQAELGRLASRLSLVASGPARKAKPAKPTQLKVTVKETGKGSAAISVETPKDGGLKGWWLRLDTSAGRLKLEAPSRATLQDVPRGGATVNCFAISPDGKTWLCRDIKVQGKQSSVGKRS